MEQRVWEGTWEEILTNVPELRGKRVRLTVLSDDRTQPQATVSLAHVLKERIGRVQFQPTTLSSHVKKAFTEILFDKYR